MIYILAALCAALLLIICLLLLRLRCLRAAAAEIRSEFARRLEEDTNVGIDIATADRSMRLLAADIDAQLKRLRKAHLRYAAGDRELKEAVTNIAHDLRTPLTAICGYMELLEREPMPEEVRGYLGIIAGRVEALRQLTEELLRYSVIISVPGYGSREAVIVNHAIEESMAALYGVLVDRGISPDIFLPDEQIVRRVNKAALSRILENILGNATKYSDGDLRVTLAADGVMTFENHAAGLDEVSVGRMFDRFYTVPDGQSGTGLGLSIAKALTEQMGGSIAAKIEGGVFSIRLSFPEAGPAGS